MYLVKGTNRTESCNLTLFHISSHCKRPHNRYLIVQNSWVFRMASESLEPSSLISKRLFGRRELKEVPVLKSGCQDRRRRHKKPVFGSSGDVMTIMSGRLLE